MAFGAKAQPEGKHLAQPGPVLGHNNDTLAEPGTYSRSHSRRDWIILSILLLIEFLSFHTMVQRDIAGLYPLNVDQQMYLMHSYESFEAIRQHGISTALLQALFTTGKPTGVLLQAEAAFAYTLFGANRSTALSLLFLHFALLQVVIFQVFRRISGRNAGGYLAVTLLLFSVSRHFYAGGFNDFRLDFAASCLYGVVFGSLSCSDRLSNRRWVLLFVLALAALVSTRFVSASYAYAALLLTMIVWLFDGYASASSEAIRGQLRRAAIVVGASAALTIPLVWVNFRQFFDYYFIGHFASPEKSVRAAEQGVIDRLSDLLFYPRSLLWDHLGITFLLISAIVLAGGIGIGLVTRVRSTSPVPAERIRYRSLVITCIWLLTPMLLFTLDESKSPVVAGVVVVPAAALVCQLYLLASSQIAGNWTFRKYELVGVLFLLCISGVYYVSLNARRFHNLQAAKDATDLYTLYDQIAERIQRNALKQPAFATGASLDYFSGGAVRLMIYERTGRLVDARELLATTVMAIPKEAVLSALDQADFALISLVRGVAGERSVLPFEHAMNGYREALLSRASERMLPLRRVTVGDHIFQIFERPQVSIFGTSAGWLPNTGVTLRLEGDYVKKYRHILLSGPTIQSRELNGKLDCRAFVAVTGAAERISLPTRTYLGMEDYAIGIDISAIEPAPTGPKEINLEFPTYFVPKDRGINDDTRKLVVLEPKFTRLVSGISDYPQTLIAPAGQ